MKRFYWALGLIATLVAPDAWAAQDVANTRHNLSTVTPVGVTRTFASTTIEEICVFCHTPHNSLPAAPLWNHLPTAAVSYTRYSSTTMTASPGQPTGKSRLCLACHDGTVALGALNNPPAGNDMAATLLTGRTHLGTDLSDDHPISFDYDAAVPGELVDPVTIDLPLEGTQLQCTTCHDPHERDLVPFLQKTTADGLLCTTCHGRSGANWDWATSSHATSGAATPATVWPERQPEWPGATVAANGCLSCHDLHTAAVPQRLVTKVEENTCYACHNGTVAATDMQFEFGKMNRHPVAFSTPNPDHDATKVEDPLSMPMHVECMDCHNSHAVAAADPMISLNPVDLVAPHTTAPAANALIAGVTGIDLNGTPVTEITDQYELCFKCHGRPGRGPCGDLPGDRCTTADMYSMVRSDGVYNIRDKVNSNNPALVSWHPIETNNPANNGEVQSLLSPLNTVSSLIYCTDCHNNDQSSASGGLGPDGPHGSTYQFMLGQQYVVNGEANYSPAIFDLCFKCHDETRFGSPTPGAFDHEIHMQGGAITCVGCHDPHGSQKFPHLINFLLFTTSGGTWTVTSDCGGGPGSCGRPEPTFEDLGVQSGRCFLNCHGTQHDGSGDFTY